MECLTTVRPYSRKPFSFKCRPSNPHHSIAQEFLAVQPHNPHKPLASNLPQIYVSFQLGSAYDIINQTILLLSCHANFVLFLFAPYYYASMVLSLICVCEAFLRLSPFSSAPNLVYS